MGFPKHFPEQCPPDTASDVRGELFRFVTHKPPDASDFVSHYSLGKKFDKGKLCQACGLSVLLTEADVKECLKTSPFFRKKYIARGRVAPEWGKIAQTGKGAHHTWWVTEGKNPEVLFDVVEIR
jgi:hypothetical protein